VALKGIKAALFPFFKLLGTGVSLTGKTLGWIFNALKNIIPPTSGWLSRIISGLRRALQVVKGLADSAFAFASTWISKLKADPPPGISGAAGRMINSAGKWFQELTATFNKWITELSVAAPFWTTQLTKISEITDAFRSWRASGKILNLGAVPGGNLVLEVGGESVEAVVKSVSDDLSRITLVATPDIIEGIGRNTVTIAMPQRGIIKRLTKWPVRRPQTPAGVAVVGPAEPWISEIPATFIVTAPVLSPTSSSWRPIIYGIGGAGTRSHSGPTGNKIDIEELEDFLNAGSEFGISPNDSFDIAVPLIPASATEEDTDSSNGTINDTEEDTDSSNGTINDTEEDTDMPSRQALEDAYESVFGERF
jgi:hypothetical protein